VRWLGAGHDVQLLQDPAADALEPGGAVDGFAACSTCGSASGISWLAISQPSSRQQPQVCLAPDLTSLTGSL
jgi:hypothetical protein